jgi:hypothetical protein
MNQENKIILERFLKQILLPMQFNKINFIIEKISELEDNEQIDLINNINNLSQIDYEIDDSSLYNSEVKYSLKRLQLNILIAFIIKAIKPKEIIKTKREIDKLIMKKIDILNNLLNNNTNDFLNNNNLPRELPKELPRELPRDLPRDLPRELPKELPREFPKELPKTNIFTEDKIIDTPYSGSIQRTFVGENTPSLGSMSFNFGENPKLNNNNQSDNLIKGTLGYTQKDLDLLLKGMNESIDSKDKPALQEKSGFDQISPIKKLDEEDFFYDNKNIKLDKTLSDIILSKTFSAPKILENLNENLLYFLKYNDVTIRNNFLNKYNNFILNKKENIIGEIKKIGAVSANGFNSLIILKNNDDLKNFNVILKVSQKKYSDNNYYEYYAGNCINLLKQYVPNFVYTFKHSILSKNLKKEMLKKYDSKLNFENKEMFTSEQLFTNIKNISDLTNNTNIESGCENNNRSGVLIDSVYNALSFNDLFDDVEFMTRLDYNMFCILIQIYGALSIVKNNFTHYDLHTGNILFSKLDKPIKIIYNDDKHKQYIIYTKFIPVIIDYGRAYVNCKNISENIDSDNFINRACFSSCNESNPDCYLYPIGMPIYKDENKGGVYDDNSNFAYINPRVNNKSHDLRFIYIIIRYNKDKIPLILDIYNNHFNKKNNPDWWDPILNGDGVPEQTKDSVKIKTVSDFYNLLKNEYYETHFNKEEYKTNDILGTMNIYTDLKTKWTFDYN